MANKEAFVKSVMEQVSRIVDDDFGFNPDWDIKEQCACVMCDAQDPSEQLVFMMDIKNGHYWVSPVYTCRLFENILISITEEYGFENEDEEWMAPMDFSDDSESDLEGLEDFMDTVPGAEYFFWNRLN